VIAPKTDRPEQAPPVLDAAGLLFQGKTTFAQVVDCTNRSDLDRLCAKRAGFTCIMTTDPVLIAYTAKRTKSGRTAWSRIGQAYPHETGAGLTVVLDSVPLDGRIILLELDERDHERLAAGRARRSADSRRDPSE